MWTSTVITGQVRMDSSQELGGLAAVKRNLALGSGENSGSSGCVRFSSFMAPGHSRCQDCPAILADPVHFALGEPTPRRSSCTYRVKRHCAFSNELVHSGFRAIDST